MNTSALYPANPVLIMDDDELTRDLFSDMLNLGGFTNIATCGDSRVVSDLIMQDEPYAILLDLSMPHINGLELLKNINRDHPDIPLIIATGTDELETAVKCMREGAFDYIVKPVEQNRMISSVQRAIQLRELMIENRQLSRRLQSNQIVNPEAFDGIVTRSPLMQSIFRYIETVSKTSKPISITGETGTGKELIARAIHNICGECAFVTVNVAGLDDQMFSDTLFGHKKGAFTGAIGNRGGLIEKAAGGILFLDEIGDLGTVSQVKLLRLIQNGEYMQLGADVPSISTARIIAATNRDLDQLQRKGTFRPDLYFRLTTHRVHIPPLRERREDLGQLVDHFIAEASRELRKPPPKYPPELLTLLSTYSFPGNVRELESMVFEAVSNHLSMMLSMNVFTRWINKDRSNPIPAPVSDGKTEPPVMFPGDMIPLKAIARHAVQEAMRRADGNQSIAAGLLGISRQALNRRLKDNDVNKKS